MRAAGVHGTSRWSCCDDADGTIAARAWWLLRYHGYPSVRVLDGGFRAWSAAGQPVSTEDAHARPGDFSARPGNMPALDATQAAVVARSGILLDARAPARYRGETEPVDRVAGHIPGALERADSENVTSAGVLQVAGELRSQVEALGVRFSRRRCRRGRRLLRVRGDRGARGARAGAGGRDRRAVRRLLVGLARRSGAAGRDWPAAGHDDLDRLSREEPSCDCRTHRTACHRPGARDAAGVPGLPPRHAGDEVRGPVRRAARLQASPPSTLTLLGLVRHMAEVERTWFRRVINGEDIPLVWSTPATSRRPTTRPVQRRGGVPRLAGRRSSTRAGSSARQFAATWAGYQPRSGRGRLAPAGHAAPDP